MAVEEGAVDPGGAGDAGDADLVAVVDRVAEGFEDALAAARRSRLVVRRPWLGSWRAGRVSVVVMRCAPGGGRAGVGGRGMPRMTVRWRRTTATACVDLVAFVGGEVVEAGADPGDETADPGDLLLGGGGFGAGPVVEVGGGEQSFPVAEQVIEVGLQVGQVGDVGAEVVAAGAAEPERAGVAAGFDVGRFGADPERDGDLADGAAGVFGVEQWLGRRARSGCRAGRTACAATRSTASRRRVSPTR